MTLPPLREQGFERFAWVVPGERPGGAPHNKLIEFVEDRPAHDHRYAIDPAKIGKELGWASAQDFEKGLEATVSWYLENETWWRPVRDGHYRGERLGRGK